MIDLCFAEHPNGKALCTKVRGHEGKHRSSYGREWSDAKGREGEK